MKRTLLFLVLCAGVGAAALQQDTFSLVLIPDTQFYSAKDLATYRKQPQLSLTARLR